MRVAIAVVYATDVRSEEMEDPQTDTFERLMSDIKDAPGTKILFASGVLFLTESQFEDPDMDVDVRSHGSELEAVPYP